MNLDTLENRLLSLIRRPTQRLHQQQQQQQSNASNTLIPTPGVPQSVDVMVTSAVVNTGSYSMPMGNSQMMPTPGFNNTSNMSVDSTMVSNKLNLPILHQTWKLVLIKFEDPYNYEFLMKRQQTREIPPNNVVDIARRLEEGLFKTATSKEEYMNLDILENRLLMLIRRPPNNYISNNNNKIMLQIQ